MNSDYLFPARLTRRDFLKTAGAAAALAAPPLAAAAPPRKEAVRIGSGKWQYELDESWGKLAEGMNYGFGCGIVCDSKDRIYVTTRSQNPCVAIFDRKGALVETWSKEFADTMGYSTAQVADTAHCVYWSQEGKEEFLYFTENVSTNKEGVKLGKRVVKTDLTGKILYEIGNVAKVGSAAQKFDWTNPTDVAVAPNGDIYVVDGYGSQRVSRFDRNFTHIKTIGERTPKDKAGPEAPHGTFNTCHGVWINTLRKDGPEVYIADRHNGRIEVFDLALEYKRTISGDFVRNPCCFYQHRRNLFIPDLFAMVTILDDKDQPVARLGDGRSPDGKGRVPEVDKNPALFAFPHALCLDSQGSLYVLEWLPYGRVRKFRKV